MRPHTWSKPKPLIGLAGKAVLDYVIDQFDSVPNRQNAEFVFIVGPQGDQVRTYMDHHYPDTTAHYVLQSEMRGQSDALFLAREYLHGPVLMAFSDTLIETDLSFLKDETCDVLAWVKRVEDPRRFGVAEINSAGLVTRLIEKPQDIHNNLVVVGFYYFKSGEQLIAAIEEQMRRKVTLRGEFFLTDAINILLEQGICMRTREIQTWLDAGTIDALLETNQYLLTNRADNSAEIPPKPGVSIIPPVYIHPSARIEACAIGPYVSVGRDCSLSQAVIKNSILEDGTQITRMILEDSVVGSNVRLVGQATRLNLGDNSWAQS